jgi:uncharacterized protein YidB (DUF937 family)
MGLLDDILAGMLSQDRPQAGPPAGQAQITQAQLAGMAQAVIAMLNDPRVGGLQGLLQRLQQAGLGDVVSSWVGTGQNQPIDPRQLQQAMPDDVTSISRQAGLGAQQGGSLLAQLLPQLIDRLTPNGRVPQQDQVGPLLQSLLR